MKINIVKNKYLNALYILMLVSAGLHVAILFLLAVTHGDLYFLNYFNIIDIDYFIPNFLNSVAGNLIAGLFTLGLYLSILYINKAE